MLEEITEGIYHKCFRDSENAGDYEGLLTELSNAAGDLWCDIEKTGNEIKYSRIPMKARKTVEEDEETENSAFWFNTVALTLAETDVFTLFDRENNFEDYEKEKQKRLRMLERLTKKDFMWLVQTVSSLIIQYLDLCVVWEAIKGTIEELDSRQAYAKGKEGMKEPRAAYL